MALVGIDIGATKTLIAVSRGEDATEQRLLPTNQWRTRHYGADAHALVALIGMMDEAPTVLVVGSHGCDNGAECMAFQAEFRRLLDAPVLVVNDAELLVPAAGHDHGIGVVAGTGSIAVSRLLNGQMLVAGGWGWLLGDEGGAVGLVREAVRAVRFALDAGDTSDALIEHVKRTLDTDDPTAFGEKLLREGNGMLIGQHVLAVFAAAGAGSALAQTVIGEGGRALATLSAQLAGRGATGNVVVTGGGVVTRQPELLEGFRDALEEILPDWRLELLEHAPVHGAIALARLIAAGTVPYGHGPALFNQPLPAVGRGR